MDSFFVTVMLAATALCGLLLTLDVFEDEVLYALERIKNAFYN